jgi:hypothetical protein
MAPRRTTPAAAACAALVAAVLALGSAPSTARAQGMCSRGAMMSGARAFRDSAAQAACSKPCVAVAWHVPVGDLPCITGYDVTLEDAETGEAVATRSARKAWHSSTHGLVVSGAALQPIHEYKVTLTTKYSAGTAEKSSFKTLSSSA